MRKLFVLGFALGISLMQAVAQAENEPPKNQPLPCSKELHQKSLTGSPELFTQIVFVNNSESTVDVYWLDYSGARVLYGTLAPGEFHVQGTYVTHPWVIADKETGECIQMHLPHGTLSVAVVE